MQVFVPLPDFAASVATLDTMRLGKQRVETYQLVLASVGLRPGKKQARNKDGSLKFRQSAAYLDSNENVVVPAPTPVWEWNGRFEPRDAKGWMNHPARLAWKDNLPALLRYQYATCDEWRKRGAADTCANKTYKALKWAFAEDLGFYWNDSLILPELREWLCDAPPMPWWWGRDDVHASHRSNLLRKDPDHYGQFGWTEPDNLEYVWPHTLQHAP